jgi:hypothetical protein
MGRSHVATRHGGQDVAGSVNPIRVSYSSGCFQFLCYELLARSVTWPAMLRFWRAQNRNIKISMVCGGIFDRTLWLF